MFALLLCCTFSSSNAPEPCKFLLPTAGIKQNRHPWTIGKPIPKNRTARSAMKSPTDAATPCRLFEINFPQRQNQNPQLHNFSYSNFIHFDAGAFQKLSSLATRFRGVAGATACQFFGKLSGIRSSPAPLGFETKKNERLANSLFVWPWLLAAQRPHF